MATYCPDVFLCFFFFLSLKCFTHIHTDFAAQMRSEGICNTFSMSLLKQIGLFGSFTRFHGRWLVVEGWTATADTKTPIQRAPALVQPSLGAHSPPDSKAIKAFETHMLPTYTTAKDVLVNCPRSLQNYAMKQQTLPKYPHCNKYMHHFLNKLNPFPWLFLPF